MTSKKLTFPNNYQRHIIFNEISLTLYASNSIAIGAKELIWNEFFKTRNRGINWDTHFTWANKGDFLCISAKIDSKIVATLLIRKMLNSKILMIGCVCVHPDYRGKKLSSAIMEYAIDIAETSGYRGIVLWTRKPCVYKKFGFTIDKFENIYTFGPNPIKHNINIQLNHWPDKNSNLDSLPPYAKAGWRAANNDAYIIFVDAASGPILLEMQGDPGLVYQLMSHTRPSTWSATLNVEDNFIAYLINENISVNHKDGPITMFKPIGDTNEFLPPIPLMNRI